MDRLRLSTSDHKYTIVQPETGLMYLLRYGEPWSSPGESIKYSNMILDLAYELLELRERVVEKRSLTELIGQALRQMKEEMARRRS